MIPLVLGARSSRGTGARGGTPAVVLAAASALLALALASCTTTTPVPPAPRPPAQVGVSLPSYHYDVGAVQRWEKTVGHRADVLQTFVSWDYAGQPDLSRFPAARAEQIARGGRTLEITWVPARSGGSGDDDDDDYSLDSIAAGEHDGYVRSFARAVEASGLRVRLRLGHEMNGPWTPYSVGRDGNGPGDFARAWRHVHDVFADVGATDVVWVWSPNVVGSTTTALPGLYPGDAFVDLVGIDGYSYPKSGCPGPGRLFDPTLAQVRKITKRPVVLAEVGVARTCPDRAAWVTALFAWAHGHHVREVTWWERGDDGRGGGDDFRLVGDRAALEAYRAAVDR